MINKMLNNVLNRSSRMLSESKDKITSAAKKIANEEIKSQIPSPADLEVQLKSLQTNNTEGLLKAEKVYNRFISLIDRAIMKLEATKAELESIKMKLNSITDNLNNFDIVINIAKDAISLARGVLAGFDGVLAASSSTFSNGLLINKTGEKKKDLKDNLKKARASIDGFSSNTSFFNTEINKLMNPLNKGIRSLETQIQRLKDLKAQLVAIYEKFILSLSITELNDEVSGEGLPNELNKDDLNTILSDELEMGRGPNGDTNGDDEFDDFPDENPPPFTFKKFNQ